MGEGVRQLGMNQVHIAPSGGGMLKLEINGGWPRFDVEVLVSDGEGVDEHG